MATPVYVAGASGAQRGVKSTETGIAVEGFDQTYSNEKSYLLDRFGEPLGFAINFNARLVITISGEVTGSTGLLAAEWNAAFTPAAGNLDLNAYPRVNLDPWNAAATFYLDDASISQQREAWKSTTATLTSIEAIT